MARLRKVQQFAGVLALLAHSPAHAALGANQCKSPAALAAEIVNQIMTPAVVRENSGIAITVDASCFAGGFANLEFVNINGEVRGYCAVGVEGKIEVPNAQASIGVSQIAVRGCKNADHYAGGFLSFGASVGGEFLGEVCLNPSVSYGTNFNELAKVLYSHLAQRGSRLLDEIIDFNSCLLSGRPAADSFKGSLSSTLLFARDNVVNNMSAFSREGKTEIKKKIDQVISKLKQPGIGKCPKELQQKIAEAMKKFPEKYVSNIRQNKASPAQVLPRPLDVHNSLEEAKVFEGFPALKDFEKDISTRIFTGCDNVAMGVSAGVGVSVAEVNVGVSGALSHYTDLGISIPVQSMIKEGPAGAYKRVCRLVDGFYRCTQDVATAAVIGAMNESDSGVIASAGSAIKGAATRAFQISNEMNQKLIGKIQDCLVGNAKKMVAPFWKPEYEKLAPLGPFDETPAQHK